MGDRRAEIPGTGTDVAASIVAALIRSATEGAPRAGRPK
jgi:hypothetical protein